MAKNPVGWFEIYVDDMERAKKFYQDVLEVELQRLEGPDVEMWTFPMVQNSTGSAGSLVRMDGFKAGGNSVLVYFKPVSYRLEAGSRNQNSPSGSMDLSPSRWTPKATCSVSTP